MTTVLGRAALGHVAGGRAKIGELRLVGVGIDRRGDADDGGFDAVLGQGGSDVEALAEKGAYALFHPGLEEVRPALAESVEHDRRGVDTVNGEALARKSHREGQPHIAQPDHADSGH